MPKNKLITVLSSLDSDEWKQVRKYILMHTGRSSDVFRLFEYLQKRRQDWPDKWDTKQVHERIFSKINHKTFLNMMSTLSLWTDEWLLLTLALKRTISSEINLYTLYTERGLYKLADRQMKKIEALLNKMDPKDTNSYKLKRKLYHKVYFSNNPIKYREGSEILTKTVTAHVLYSIEQELLYLAELHNWGKIRNEDFSEHIGQLQNRIHSIPLDENHHLKLLVKMVASNDFISFKKLRDLLFDDDWDIKSQTHILIASYLINWVMKFWQKGLIKDSNIITNLYEYGLETEVLMVNGRIPEQRFHNIVSTIGALKRGGWNSKFINKWGKKVNSKDPSQNAILANVQCSFYNETYSEITLLSRSLKFEPEGQQTRLMGLQMIAWFEEREENPELFLQHTNNFKRFLRRHATELSKHYHDGHYNLIKILEGIFNQVEKSKLETILKNEKSLMYRIYAQSKINQY